MRFFRVALSARTVIDQRDVKWNVVIHQKEKKR
jgi:hypothetical protein